MKKIEFDKCLSLVERYITENPKCEVYRNSTNIGNICAPEGCKSDDNTKNVIIKVFDKFTFSYDWQTEDEHYFVQFHLHNDSYTSILNPEFEMFEFIMNKYYLKK
jgi:hypothetical protein